MALAAKSRANVRIPCPSSRIRGLTFLFIQFRLPPEVNRVLFVKNLPFKTTTEELFGKYGPIRQIRVYVLLLCYDAVLESY